MSFGMDSDWSDISTSDEDGIDNYEQSTPDEDETDDDSKVHFQACDDGDKQLGELLLDEGARVGCRDSGSGTPLHSASSDNRVICLWLLLQDDSANINWVDNGKKTVLDGPCGFGCYILVHALVNFWADPNLTEYGVLFQAAIGIRSLTCTRLLLQFGADVNVPNVKFKNMPLHEAADEVLIDLARWLFVFGACDVQNCFEHTSIHTTQFSKCVLREVTIEIIDKYDQPGMTLLMAAAKDGNPSCVKLLLEKGAHANIYTSKGLMAIHFAIDKKQNDVYFGISWSNSSDHLECFKMLLNAMPSETLDLFKSDVCNKSLRSLFHEAVRHEKPEMIDLLISKDLNVNIYEKFNEDEDLDYFTNKYMTPLSLAAKHGNVDIMKKLTDVGAEVHCCYDNVMTPLLASVANGIVGAVKLLLDHDAMTCASCHLLDSTMELVCLAIKFDSVEVFDLLLKSGANLNEDWKDDVESTIFSCLVDGERGTADHRQYLAVLLDHLTYSNFNSIFMKMIDHFQYDVEMVKYLEDMLRTPHSLQHLCRVVVRTWIPVENFNTDFISEQFFLPRNVRDYLMFKH